MSADNYYIIRNHPHGGYAAVMGFASDVDSHGNEIFPDATQEHQKFETLKAALDWAVGEYSEYGVSIHEECVESRSQVRRINKMLETGQ